MAAFQGYARNNGFDPITIPDTSERDLRAADRELKSMQRAYETQDKYSRAVQTQVEKNQRLESEARVANFELNDKFIKQNREAEKRNFDTRIRNAEQKEAKYKGFSDFAMSMSKTFAQKYSDKMVEKRNAEKDFMTGLIYKYGVTSQERAEIDAIEGEISSMNGDTSPAVKRLRAAGATTAELEQLANMSGYAELGANIGLAQNAGNNYGAYVGADRQKYQVGDKMMTYAEAYSNGDVVALNTIQSQQRINYINEATPGMDPMFLDKHMFDKIRAFEGGQNAQVSQIARTKFEENQKLQQQQEMMVFINNAQGMGPSNLWDTIQDTGDARAQTLSEKVATLGSVVAANLPGSRQFADDFLNQVVSKNGQPDGRFRDLYPLQAAKLEEQLTAGLKNNNQQQQAKLTAQDLRERRLWEKIKSNLFADGFPTNATIEIYQQQFSNNPAILAKLENAKTQSANAFADTKFTNDLARMQNLGLPITQEWIRNQKNVSPTVLQQGLKNANVKDAITQTEKDDFTSYIKGQLKGIAKAASIDELDGIASATPATRSLLNKALKSFQSEMQSSNVNRAQAIEKTYQYINDQLKTPDYQYQSGPDDKDSLKQEGFQGFLFDGSKPVQDSLTQAKINEINENPESISTKLILEKSDLEQIARVYNEDGNFSRANLDDFVRLASELPNVSYEDLLLGQMEYHGIKNFNYKSPIDNIDQADPDAVDAARRLSRGYANGTQSRIAEIGLGATPPRNLNLDQVQQQATQIIADVESGQWGYQAVNQGTAPDGAILGSGPITKHYPGMDLTKQTLGQVRALQNENFSGSDDQWRASGGLWAVGKYQFIPSTLQMLMDKSNISPDTLFSPELQDYFALQFLTIQGPQAWIGVMEHGRLKISQAKYDILQQAASMQFPDFGPSKWRQPDTMNPEVVRRYTNGNN